MIIRQHFGLIFHTIGFGDFPDNPAGIACCKTICRNISGYHTSRTNYTVIANRDARADGHGSAKPAVISNMYRLRITEMPFLSLCGQHYQALIQERGMNGRNNGYVGTKIAIITNLLKPALESHCQICYSIDRKGTAAKVVDLIYRMHRNATLSNRSKL